MIISIYEICERSDTNREERVSDVHIQLIKLTGPSLSPAGPSLRAVFPARPHDLAVSSSPLTPSADP